MLTEAFRKFSAEFDPGLSPIIPSTFTEEQSYYFHARFDITPEIASKSYDYLTFPSIRQQMINRQVLPQQPLVTILAHHQGQVVGMALAQLWAEEKRASLCSICVLPDHRRHGVGSSLLRYLEQVLIRHGFRQLEYIYQTTWSNHSVVASILERQGWRVRPYQLVLRITREQLAQAPVLKQYHLPKPFTVFPWEELTPADRQAVQQRQASESWYPPEQNPFQCESFIEPQSSLGLRHQGQVIGWKIHHHFTPDTVRRMLLFLSPEYRGHGVGIALLVESLRRYVDTRIPFYTAEVEVGNLQPVAWWQRHLAPTLAELIETHRAEKQLGE